LEQEDVNQWHDVVQDEYKSLIKNKILNLTKLPLGKHVNYRWDFKQKKLKVNGQVDKYKACLVAKVYSQVLDIIILKLFH
jgi:hypothetical protein